jgi:MtaA/CmuA family methyltransferase
MLPTMSSLERVDRVIRGGIPDRVPVDLHNFLMTAEASGLPFPEFLQDGEAMAQAQILAWREYAHDLVILENGTVALAEACGCGIEYVEGSAPVLVSPVLHSLEDVDGLEVPDPYRAHLLAENLKATRIVAREIGKQACVMGRADQGPFSLASMLFGMENFLMALTEPENRAGIHRLLDFCLQVVTRYALAQKEQGAAITSIGESLSGPDVSSPRIYKEFAWGYVKRLVDRLRTEDLPLSYHICGNATRIAGGMAASGAAILELDYKCDLPKVKAEARGKAAILGVIDPSGVLALGTPQLVTDKVREELDLLAEGGGLILGPGCALPPKTPPENIHALIEAAHRFGRYAADGRLIPG